MLISRDSILDSPLSGRARNALLNLLSNNNVELPIEDSQLIEYLSDNNWRRLTIARNCGITSVREIKEWLGVHDTNTKPRVKKYCAYCGARI